MTEMKAKKLGILGKFSDCPNAAFNFITQYENLRDHEQPTIYHFYKHTDEIYTVHGNCAKLLTEELLKNHDKQHMKHSGSHDKLLTLELGYNNMTYTLRKLLLEFGYKVVLRDWDFVNSKVKSVKHASPGNIRAVEEFLYEDGDFSSQENTSRIIVLSVGDVAGESSSSTRRLKKVDFTVVNVDFRSKK